MGSIVALNVAATYECACAYVNCDSHVDLRPAVYDSGGAQIARARLKFHLSAMEIPIFSMAQAKYVNVAAWTVHATFTAKEDLYLG